MSEAITPTEVLFESIENYSKTSFQLFRLNMIAKIAEIVSILASNLILIFFILLFLITTTIAISLWIGEMLGKSYYGFFLTSSFYGLIALVIYFFKNECLKQPISNYMINKLL